jgi:hypothetical protein
MEYLDWIWIALKWALCVWGFSFILRIFLPESIQEIFRSIDLFLLEKISAIPVLLSNIWLVVATVLYFVGNFTVLVLLAFGVFMLIYSIRLHLVNFEYTFDWLYQLSKQLVEEKAAWSGATMIVGATVAVAHMWKLTLDRKQYFEKKEKERREEYRAKISKDRLP